MSLGMSPLHCLVSLHILTFLNSWANVLFLFNRQTKNVAAIPHLKARLLDLNEDAIVRHECAEALGAIGDLSSLELLKELRTEDQELVVRETCEIAVDRIEWENSEVGKKEILKQRYEPRIHTHIGT